MQINYMIVQRMGIITLLTSSFFSSGSFTGSLFLFILFFICWVFFVIKIDRIRALLLTSYQKPHNNNPHQILTSSTTKSNKISNGEKLKSKYKNIKVFFLSSV